MFFFFLDLGSWFFFSLFFFFFFFFFFFTLITSHTQRGYAESLARPTFVYCGCISSGNFFSEGRLNFGLWWLIEVRTGVGDGGEGFSSRLPGSGNIWWGHVPTFSTFLA